MSIQLPENQSDKGTIRIFLRSAKVLAYTVLVAGCAFGVLYAKHKAWMTAPNDFFIGPAFDGLKNYFTFSYNVAHDTTFVRYTGMNYPYGEHELFTDNQPILSNFAQWWHWNVSDLSQKTVGIHNVFQITSVVFGAVILFWVLAALGMPLWYAAVVALGIHTLNPQHLRFNVHFGLSHTWIFPLLLLLLRDYERRQSRRYVSLWIALLVLIGGMLHFYNFGMAVLFLGLYSLGAIFTDFSRKNIFARLSHLAVMVFLPYFVLNLWIHWDAYAADRTTEPSGFTYYIGQWEAVFLPYKGFPMHQWISEALMPIRTLNTFESLAYVGVVGTTFFLTLLFTGFKFFRKNDNVPEYAVGHKDFLRRSLISAILLLLFGLGFPFAIPSFEWILDYFGPIRQFRGLGRFCWPFFYLINISAFFTLYHVARKKEKSWVKYGILAIPILILWMEARLFQKTLTSEPWPNVLLTEKFEEQYGENAWIKKVDWTQFQALLPLPYYHIGSENISAEPEFDLFYKTQTTACHTGLPDMGVMMSRTSVSQTVQSLQMAYRPTQVPEILDWLPNRKPFAVFVQPRHKEEVLRRYPHLMAGAKPVLANTELEIFSLSPDSIRQYAVREKEKLELDMDSRQLFPTNTAFFSTVSGKNPIHVSFDDEKESSLRLRGAGAMRASLADTVWIYAGNLPKGQYSISLWTYAKKDMGLRAEMKIFEHSAQDGREIAQKLEVLRYHVVTFLKGWAMYDLPFEVREENSQVKIFLPPLRGTTTEYYIDEVLIKPSGASFYLRDGEMIGRDGFWYE